jgi:hypothetical protein
LSALHGEVEQVLTLPIVEFVELTEVPDVARACTALTGFQTAYLGWRHEQPFGYLLYGPATLVSKISEQRAEFPAPDGRTA